MFGYRVARGRLRWAARSPLIGRCGDRAVIARGDRVVIVRILDQDQVPCVRESGRMYRARERIARLSASGTRWMPYYVPLPIRASSGWTAGRRTSQLRFARDAAERE